MGPEDPSTVFGLVGPWGSGKTSILNQVRSRLSGIWEVADFSPWSGGDSGAVSLEFVRTLTSLLGGKLRGEQRRTFVGYASYVTPLIGIVPFVGSGARGSVERAFDALAQRPPWQKQFDELSAKIQDLGKRVLVIVDDVDRLGVEELITLLKVLRLLGRFRGVHYLIAYDQETVEGLLRTPGADWRTASFMEKIVQYPFETPPVPQATARRLLQEGLQELLEATDERLDPVGVQRVQRIIEVIAPQLRTPRTIGRFLEHLHAFASHVTSSQLDLPDYVAITWLRLAAHGTWSKLADWGPMLRTGKRRRGGATESKMSEADWEELIRQTDSSAEIAPTQALLAVIFPGVKAQGENSYQQHRRSIADKTYFGRYMLLAIPEDDVSDSLVEEVIRGGGGSEQDAELSAIIDGTDWALANLAISRLRELCEQIPSRGSHLVEYVVARLQARSHEEEAFSSPVAALQELLAFEVGAAMTKGTMDARAVIALVGEKTSLRLLWRWSSPEVLRDGDGAVLKQFGEYWLGELLARPDRVRGSGMFPEITEVLLHTHPAESMSSLLDPMIPDYESFLQLADSFVELQTWVGPTNRYALRFRGEQLISLVSREKLAPLLDQAAAKAGREDYTVQDLESPDIAPEVRRAFLLGSLRNLKNSIDYMDLAD
ncbi:hypothetical protein BMH32_08320 [Leucobacter sp. OLJS4]|nr:hypothetical protein BMH26_10330 [Leucobacter sp. OLTLW20]PII94429.1 hypothetical protein BMH27_00070 [Leucobacter sp. OLAS13]PIJ00771.1 hypothetical protein BMH29_01445 [Leucobacter sp. OLDS2]PIJ00830.1 hypothetical protein BMH28_08775 [Leucobacter sp. OLCS4]PIJ03405.1 hypothetical protein BMH31_08025 [Leucobacter sp. OLIS6]PIJ10742.1 hypothetical protein BMH32_08320 [Leucobacter sp. OLJS4]PIJ53518.1 hypothetical protein BV503_12485 [Leucobacter sp. OAMSW11]PIJ55504.1 hypothetical protei